MIKEFSKQMQRWLLFFYSTPSKPVASRMKIWRKLTRVGALPFKGAVYILPDNEENLEYFQWLVSEVESMGGEGAFVRVEKVETANSEEIIHLFNQQREREYHRLEKALEEIERKLAAIKKGGTIPTKKKLLKQFTTIMREFEEIKKIDFFSSRKGEVVKRRMKLVEAAFKRIAGPQIKKQQAVIVPKNVKDYKGKIWVTRRNPFVDRMASAWLIKRFIDKEAVFQFREEREMANRDENMVLFDVRGGEFTHVGEMCTFETILKSFGLKDKGLKKIGEVVHELDLKDGRYKSSEASGIEGILVGIRRMSKNDAECLEKGMSVFEMLYESKT
jgi:hypothetical protein